MPWGGRPFRPHPEPPEELGLLGALRAQQGVAGGRNFSLRFYLSALLPLPWP